MSSFRSRALAEFGSRPEPGAKRRESSDSQGPANARRSSGAYGRVFQIIALATALVFSHSGAQAQPLAAPTTLTATTYSKTQIDLVWNDLNPGPSGTQESGYIVERTRTPPNWSRVFTSGRDVTGWSSTGLSTGTTYYYRVRAFVVVGGVTTYSGYSPIASATTQSSLYPDPPTSLTATALSATQIALRWQDQASNESGFKVQRAPSSAGPWSLAGTTATNTVTYTDSGLTKQTAYVYRVRAYNSIGSSPPSNVVTATTKADDTTAPTPGTVTLSGTQFAGFVRSPFALTTTFTDNQSAVTGCAYTINGGAAWLPATVAGSAPSFTCTKTGITGSNGQVLTLAMRATSSGGTGTATSVTRTIDAAAPTTASDAAALWVATDQTVTLTASDASGSGVASTQYCTDTTNSCTPATSGTSVGVTCAAGAACQTYVRYRSTDQVGNVEATRSALVRIDKAGPGVAITGPTTAPTWITSSSLLALGGTASDNVSVTSVTWSNAATGGSGTASGTASWSASVPLNQGSNVITVTARDGFNNSATKTLTVNYAPPDPTPPTPGSVTISGTQFGNFLSSPFTLTASFTDNESAVTGCEYSVNGTWSPATVSGSAPSFTCTMTGITGSNGQVLTLAMRATSGGGTGTASAVTRTIDAAAPTTTSDAPAAWVVSDQTVTLTPSDGTGTGVASTEYCTDTANSCTPNTSGTSVTVGCPDGAACKTYVRYRSTDQVGNVEATQSALVRIDKAPWVASPGPVFTSDPSLLDGYPNDPWVMMDGSTYVMYYGATIGDFSDTNTVRIFRAASGDGINWTRDSIPRLSPGAEGSWDSVKVERPSAMKLPDSTYRMYYAGSNVRDAENGFQIGLATSDDGAGWSTYPGNPVLPFGEIGSFDDASISGACVLVKDGEYWMWYVGMSGGDSRMSIGHARSQDGIVWEKKGQVLQLDVEAEGLNEVGVSDSHVIWNGTEFEMFYAVLQDGGQVPGPIWHATSGDGVSWIKDSGPILRRGAVDSWTGQGMGSPRVLLEGDTYRMWYSGTQTDWATSFQTAIGVAAKVR